jgi:hypothetical protein
MAICRPGGRLAFLAKMEDPHVGQNCYKQIRPLTPVDTDGILTKCVVFLLPNS